MPRIAFRPSAVNWRLAGGSVLAVAWLAGLANAEELDVPSVDIDWSLGLRGTYVRDADGGRFESLALPSVTLTHRALRSAFELEASAELIKSSVEAFRVGALEARAGFEYALDQLSSISLATNLALTQASASASGLASNVAAAPLVLSGDAEATLKRQFGQVEASLTGAAARTIYGVTTLDDGSTTDNSYRNNSSINGALRLGYRVTPILVPFVEAGAGYQWFDGPSPGLLVRLDAATYTLRAGLAADWHEVFEAEASAGLALRRFADPGLQDVAAALYDASLTFRPDKTVEASAGFATTLSAAADNGGATTEVEYQATLELGYNVNPWLKLRASAEAYWTQLIGSADSETGHALGLGADFGVNAHTLVGADYAFGHDKSSTGPAEDSHQVTLGVTLSR